MSRIMELFYDTVCWYAFEPGPVSVQPWPHLPSANGQSLHTVFPSRERFWAQLIARGGSVGRIEEQLLMKVIAPPCLTLGSGCVHLIPNPHHDFWPKQDSKGKWSGRDSDGVERQHECGVGNARPLHRPDASVNRFGSAAPGRPVRIMDGSILPNPFWVSSIVSSSAHPAGLELEKNSVGEWVIAGLRPGGPAYNSGQLHVGMRVDSLDWRSIRGLSQFEVQRALYGPLGSVLTLEICASADDPMLGALRRHVTLVRFPGDQAVRPERCCAAAAAPGLSCCAPCKNCLHKMREAA